MAAPAHANGHTAKPQLGGQQARRAVAEHQAGQQAALGGLIGESVALHLAPLLGELVRRTAAQPECARCIGRAKRRIRDYEIAVKNAQQVGEPVPEIPEPPEVARSVTWQDGQPVCFDDFELAGVTPQRP